MIKIIFSIFFLLLTSNLYAANRYWVGGGSSANWNATTPTNWGSASNTQDNASVPGTGDDVFFDGIGTGASNSTLSANITVNNINFTGYANTLTHNTTTTLTIEGSLTFSSGMTYTAATSSSIIAMENSSDAIITTAGKSLRALTLGGTAGGTGLKTLGGNLTVINAITHSRGTFDTAGYTVSALSYSTSNSNARTLTFCGSTITLSGTGTIFNAATATNLTVTSCTSNPYTIALSDASASSKTFSVGTAKTFSNFSCTGGGAGAIIFATSGNTWNTLGLCSPKTFTFPSATTTTFTSLGCTGSSGNVITINSSSGGSQATLKQITGQVSCDWLNLTDSASEWVAFYAGANSSNTSNNSGWIFSAAPAVASKNTKLYNYKSY